MRGNVRTIYVAGHRGLVGSALLRRLSAESGGPPTRIVTRTHAELDLTDQHAVREFMREERPDVVYLAAARVGGIHANNTSPAEFIHANLAIQTNVIHEAWQVGVQHLLFLGSSCIYPRECPQPIREAYLLTGPLEPTNRPYAIAKIAGIEMCWSYNRQYGTRYLAAMPTNMYGPGDNYDLASSHVLPALMRKMHEAKERGDHEVVVWGSGTPRREFLYSQDLADACVFLMDRVERDGLESLAGVLDDGPPLINIGCGEDLTIRDLARAVAAVVGFEGQLAFDRSKPDGTPRKILDVSKLAALGWRATTPLPEGLRLAYADFKARYETVTQPA